VGEFIVLCCIYTGNSGKYFVVIEKNQYLLLSKRAKLKQLYVCYCTNELYIELYIELYGSFLLSLLYTLLPSPLSLYAYILWDIPRGLLKTIELFSNTSILSNYKLWKFRPTPLFSCINLRFYKRKRKDYLTEEKCKVESNITERSPQYKMTVGTA
jgi:hypothetical protein